VRVLQEGCSDTLIIPFPAYAPDHIIDKPSAEFIFDLIYVACIRYEMTIQNYRCTILLKWPTISDKGFDETVRSMVTDILSIQLRRLEHMLYG